MDILTSLCSSSPLVGDAQHMCLWSSDSHRQALQVPRAGVFSTTPRGCGAFQREVKMRVMDTSDKMHGVLRRLPGT